MTVSPLDASADVSERRALVREDEFVEQLPRDRVRWRSTVPLVTRMRNEPGSSRKRNGCGAVRDDLASQGRGTVHHVLVVDMKIDLAPSRSTGVLSAAAARGLSDSDSTGADVACDAPPPQPKCGTAGPQQRRQYDAGIS